MPLLSTLTTSAPYHLIGYGTLLGTTFFQSFIGGTVAFRALPKPQFSALQAQIFPLYFMLQSLLPIGILLTHPSFDLSSPDSITAVTGFYPILVAGLSGFTNWLLIAPEATKTKKDWARLEKDLESDEKAGEERKQAAVAMKKKFGMLHGMSMLVNMFEFVGLLVYGVQLAEKLRF